MDRLSDLYGKLLDFLAVIAALLLLAMVIIVTGDIVLRNVAHQGLRLGERGLRIFALSHHAAHRAVAAAPRPACAARSRADGWCPRSVAWILEAAGDIVGFAVCLTMIRYGTLMTLDAWQIGSITIKNLIFPEWWLLAPLPITFLLLAIEFVFRFDASARSSATAARRRLRSLERCPGSKRASYCSAAWSLVMAFGLPVAFAFLAINLVGAMIFLGGENGLIQFNRNAVQSVTAFALTPIPFFVLMGEVLFHSGVAMKAIDAFALLIRRVPGRLSVIAIVAGTVFSAISGSTIATTALLGIADAADHAGARLSPEPGHGPDHGHRRRRHADPAVGAHRAARQPRRHLDLGPADRRHRAGPDPERAVIRLYRAARYAQSGAGAGRDAGGGARGAARWRPFLIYVLPLLLIFGLVVGAMIGRLGDADGSRRARRRRHHPGRRLYRALTFANLMKALLGTVAVSGIILFIIVGATTFSQVLSFSGVVNGMVSQVTGQGLSVNALVIAMMLILLFLGCFVDQVSMMLITLPFFMPLVSRYDIDPIWFGVIFLICMQLGLLTPPFGLLLFTMKGVAPPAITMNQIYLASLPYVAMSWGFCI